MEEKFCRCPGCGECEAASSARSGNREKQAMMNERARRIALCLLQNAKGAVIPAQVFEDLNLFLLWSEKRRETEHG